MTPIEIVADSDLDPELITKYNIMYPAPTEPSAWRNTPKVTDTRRLTGWHPVGIREMFTRGVFTDPVFESHLRNPTWVTEADRDIMRSEDLGTYEGCTDFELLDLDTIRLTTHRGSLARGNRMERVASWTFKMVGAWRLAIFHNYIQTEWYRHCMDVRDKELRAIEEARIKAIGVEEIAKYKEANYLDGQWVDVPPGWASNQWEFVRDGDLVVRQSYCDHLGAWTDSEGRKLQDVPQQRFIKASPTDDQE